MSNKDIVICQTADGKGPFTQWRRGLKDKTTIARIDRRLDQFARGHNGDFRPVGEGVFESRVFFGPGYRIDFAEDGDTVVLLHGGDKSSQKQDIKRAQAYCQDYLSDTGRRE